MSSGIVAWADTDASGRFHFTAPFRWVEEAEHLAYRAAGLDPGSFPRRAVSSTFSRSLHAGDPYRVELGVQRVGASSIAYTWRILSGDAVCAEGSHTVVHVDGDGRPSAVPDSLRSLLAPG